MEIILYSTGCPRCKVLETKLKEKNISYTYIDDLDTMEAKDIYAVPCLEVDGALMDFKEAVDWVNTQESD